MCTLKLTIIIFVDGMNPRSQYLKTQIRGGQVFQLRAVFQHRDRSEGGKHSTRSSRVSRSARDKDLANRYAQLIGHNNQVPLSLFVCFKSSILFSNLKILPLKWR